THYRFDSNVTVDNWHRESNNRVLHKKEDVGDNGYSVRDFCFSPDGTWLIIGITRGGGASPTDSGKVLFYNAETLSKTGSITVNGGANHIAISGDGKVLAVGSVSKSGAVVSLWDVKEKKVNTSLQHEGVVHGLAMSPDSQFLSVAVTSLKRRGDGELKLW